MRPLVLSLLLMAGLPGMSSAGYREDFAREFMSKTWAGERVEENACIDCHSSERMKSSFRDITDEWKKSLHARNNIACHDCHGGDPKDPSLAMSHRQRGFIGVPPSGRIPALCGRCHVGILRNFNESGHGKALRTSGKGPHCAVCHGSHNIQKADIEIISEQRCSKCHTYGRAQDMKQALFLVEKKIIEIEDGIKALRRAGIYPEEQERAFFSTQAEFRTLFHTVDVPLVKERTGSFTRQLDDIQEGMRVIFEDLRSRRNFSAFLAVLFGGMGVVILLLSGAPKP